MELRVAGKETRLEAKPLEMLQVLVSKAGEVITKNELLDAVWRGESVVEGVLTTNINKLRDAIGDSERRSFSPSAVLATNSQAPYNGRRQLPLSKKPRTSAQVPWFLAVNSGGFKSDSTKETKVGECGWPSTQKLTNSGYSNLRWTVNALTA
jgi:hypothetical protein